VKNAKNNFKDEKIVIVGSSLGGALAYQLGQKYGILPILINPSLTPSKTISNLNNKVLENYVTGEKVFTGNLSEKMKKFDINIKSYGIVLLDLGDEILNSNFTYEQFKPNHKVITFTGGNHRFQHWNEAIKIIKAELNSNYIFS